MKLSIITLTYNNLGYTKKYIKSLYEYTKDFELIVVDNGSTDGTVEYLKSLKYDNLKLIFNKENLGFSKGNNQGIEIAEGEYIGFLNNDILVSANWFENIEYVFKKNKTAGFVSPIHINPHFHKTNENNYITFFNKMKYENETVKSFDGACFACVITKKSVIDEIGGFDENYTPAFFEDNDIKYRAIEAGFDCYYTNKCCFFHFGSKTTNKSFLSETFKRNRQYYYNKFRFSQYLTMSTYQAGQILELEEIKKSFWYKLIYILPDSYKILKCKTENFIKNKIIGQQIEYSWENDFKRYFAKNNMSEKLINLKVGTDTISKEYVDYFMTLSKYWNGGYARKLWTKYDEKLFKDNKKFLKTFRQPFPEIAEFNPFIFSNQYGLKDLPSEVYNELNGKAIVDVGGYNGDTAYLFHNVFPKSKVFVYEPLSVHLNKLKRILEIDNCDSKIIPIQKGLGDKDEITDISFIETETCTVTTLDTEFKDLSENIGLIKMDVEGFESKVVKGAVETIKKYKPVLAIAIYHTPEDFFDMKDKIKAINPDYKFMIRRSKAIVPQADLVLIAY